MKKELDSVREKIINQPRMKNMKTRKIMFNLLVHLPNKMTSRSIRLVLLINEQKPKMLKMTIKVTHPFPTWNNEEIQIVFMRMEMKMRIILYLQNITEEMGTIMKILI